MLFQAFKHCFSLCSIFCEYGSSFSRAIECEVCLFGFFFNRIPGEKYSETLIVSNFNILLFQIARENFSFAIVLKLLRLERDKKVCGGGMLIPC